jgi:putative DNA primase/helicase
MATATDTRPSKPNVLAVDFDGIPDALKQHDQWVMWRLTWKEDDSKWDKPPTQPDGSPASTTDPQTWSSFGDARAAYERGGFDGIGFVFDETDGLVFVDLDHCRDSRTGKIGIWSTTLRSLFRSTVPEPLGLIAGLQTFGEVSPSGSGVHLYCVGELPLKGRKKGGKGSGCPDGIEVYDQAHYATVTGRKLPGSPSTVNDCTGALTELHKNIFGEKKPTPTAASSPAEVASSEIPDSKIIEKASNAANRLKFRALFFSGDASDYTSESEADLALASSLAFWVGPDANRIEQLMRQSALVRTKWDDNKNYLPRTIEKVIDGRTEFYSWNGKKHLEDASEKSPGGKSANVRDQDAGKLETNYTDLGNAHRLVQRHGQKIRHCHPWKKWLVWDGKRWAVDNVGQIDRLAADTILNLYREAAKLDGSEQRERLVKHARSSEAAARLNAMIDKARSCVPALPDELDTHPWLLNCPNGTLDLKTGELGPHRREDMITQLCPTPYRPDAKAPRWEQFLSEIFAGSNRLVEFTHRLVGCCLSGAILDHILPILHGDGCNGKSTLLNALRNVLGNDYAAEAPPDLLMMNRHEQHPTQLARLFGKRLVVAVETEQNRQLAESLVKQLTGADTISCRRMREDFWDFQPTHKILLACNHKPRIRGVDWAIWRRIKLVPFNVTIAEHEKDKYLGEKLKAEAEGILAWAVRGCLDWQENGLGNADEIEFATQAYQSAEDTLAGFLAECCVLDDDGRARASDLLKNYREWSGNKRLSQRRFGEMLTSKGFERFTSNGTWYRGIAIPPGEGE